MGGMPSAAKWVMGFIMHLIAGGIFVLIYAVGFEYLTHRAGWLVGAGFGLIHSLFAGLFMAMMPAMHPLIPEAMPAPGAFMSNLGMMGVVAEIMLHLIYGAIVGAMYGPVSHRPVGPGVETTPVDVWRQPPPGGAPHTAPPGVPGRARPENEAEQKGEMASKPSNYDTFRRHVRQEDIHFRGGPEPGQLAPDFDLPTVAGGPCCSSSARSPDR